LPCYFFSELDGAAVVAGAGELELVEAGVAALSLLDEPDSLADEPLELLELLLPSLAEAAGLALP